MRCLSARFHPPKGSNPALRNENRPRMHQPRTSHRSCYYRRAVGLRYHNFRRGQDLNLRPPVPKYASATQRLTHISPGPGTKRGRFFLA